MGAVEGQGYARVSVQLTQEEIADLASFLSYCKRGAVITVTTEGVVFADIPGDDGGPCYTGVGTVTQASADQPLVLAVDNSLRVADPDAQMVGLVSVIAPSVREAIKLLTANNDLLASEIVEAGREV